MILFDGAVAAIRMTMGTGQAIPSAQVSTPTSRRKT